MAEVVDRELALPTRSDAPLGRGHHPGCSDQHVEPRLGRAQLLGGRAYAREVRQVHVDHGDVAEVVESFVGELGTPRGHHYVRTRLHQGAGRFQAQARVPARDHRRHAPRSTPAITSSVVDMAVNPESRGVCMLAVMPPT